MIYIPGIFQSRPIRDIVHVRSTVAHVAGWDLHMICMIQHVFPGLELYYADLTQPLRTAGKGLP